MSPEPTLVCRRNQHWNQHWFAEETDIRTDIGAKVETHDEPRSKTGRRKRMRKE